MRQLSHHLKKLASIDNLILVVGVIVLVPLVVLSCYNHPSADDYNYALNSLHLGFWKAQVDWYLHWSGRYIATMLLSVNPLFFHQPILSKLFPIVLILFQLVSAYWFFKAVFIRLTVYKRVVFSFAFTVLYVFQMPEAAQGFYWFSGAMTYQLANSFSLLFLGKLSQFLNRNKKIDLMWLIGLAFMVIGLNETSMLMIDCFTVAVLVIHTIRTGRVNKSLVVLVFFMFLFSLFVFFAPGNQVRYGFFPDKHRLFFSLYHTVKIAVISSLKWLPFLILFTLAFKGLLKQLMEPYLFSLVNAKPVYAISLFIAIPLVGYFPGFWTMGVPPPARTVNVVYFSFIVGFFYLIVVLHGFLKTKKIDLFFLPKGSHLFVLTALGCLLFFMPNRVRTAYVDLFSGKAAAYDRQLTARTNVIEATESDTCVVPALDNVPKTLYVEDISTNPKHWINEGLSDYMGKKAIYLKSPTAGPKP